MPPTPKLTVNIGDTFTAQFGDLTATVEITSECEFGGWYGTKLDTNNSVRITEKRLIAKVSSADSPTLSTNTATVKENDDMPSSTRKSSTTVTANDRRARRGVKPAAASKTTTTAPKGNSKTTTTSTTVKEQNTVPARKLTGNAAKTSTTTARKRTTKPAAQTTTAKPAAAKRKPAAKRTATVKTVDTVTVTLPEIKETANKVQYGGERGTLITGIYVHKDAVAALQENGDAYLEATFKSAAEQPKHSVRFNEQGDDKAVGSLYLTNDGIKASKFAVKSGDTLNAEFHIEDDNLVVTLTIA